MPHAKFFNYRTGRFKTDFGIRGAQVRVMNLCGASRYGSVANRKTEVRRSGGGGWIAQELRSDTEKGFIAKIGLLRPEDDLGGWDLRR